MRTFISNLRYALFFLLLTGLCWGQDVGTVGAELPNQIGVYELKTAGESELERGDIVRIVRDGEVLGEATVMSITDDQTTISLKGVYDTLRGDSVQFARKAKGVRASTSGASGSSARAKASGGKVHKNCGGTLTGAAGQCTRCKKWVSSGGFTRKQTRSMGRFGF